jgi:hypothetical protein
MAKRAKTLNLADIFRFKKDLLWGKYYYGIIESGDLKDCVLFKKLFDSKKLIEIVSVENQNQELVKEFVHVYSNAKKVRYFIQELDEVDEVDEINFIQNCGFRRFNRSYCFKCCGTENGLKSYKHLNVLCREMDNEDISSLEELDLDCQIIDFRDELYKSKSFFKNNFEDILVFSNPVDSKEIYAYAYRPNPDQKNVFEFTLHSSRSEIIFECISAFNEKFVLFDKSAEDFSFIVNESLKNQLEAIRAKHKLEWVKQKLILEGAPKSRVHNPSLLLSIKSRASA